MLSSYADRSRTFNGKLKPRCRVLVSPLDAQDVSAVIKFCRQHDLSPSVRAGGYGIPGWAVAGDVLIDLSMIRDIQLETPRIPSEDSGIDWTPMGDLSLSQTALDRDPPAIPVSSAPQNITSKESTPRSGTSAMTGAKRRRSPSPPPADRGLSDDMRRYDYVSQAVASFLQGPPLPPVPGDIPRQPPRNRPRFSSPEAEDSIEADPVPSFGSQSHEEGNATNGSSAPPPPPLDMSRRQTSDESADSSRSEGSRFSSAAETATTTPPNDKGDTTSAADTASARSRQPFQYLAGTTSGLLPIPGSAPGGVGSTSGVTAVPINFMPPAPGASSGVVAWNPATGFSSLPGAFPPIPPMMSPTSSSSNSSGSMPSTASVFPGLPVFPPGMSGMASGFLGALQGPFGSSVPGMLGVGAATPSSGPVPTSHAKPVHTHAYVTFGAGMRQREIDAYTAEHALEGVNTVSGEREERAVPYHVPMSAHPVGSSIMVLAGFGFISRMYGLSIDNVVEVEMVLADGRIVVVNKDEDPGASSTSLRGH